MPTATSALSSDHHVIPVEIVSEEEMAFIEAALLSARAAISPRSPPFLPASSASTTTTPVHSTASLPDIEDAVPIQQRKNSLFHRFRKRDVLSVTDLTASEWCEKQLEFALVHGKPKRTEAMKAGSRRHVELEEEVMTRVSVPVKSHEDKWAISFLNFIVGANHLLSEGITRELVVFQLMCYKYLWDNIVINRFPTDQFFMHFDLNPKQILSEEVKNFCSALGFHHETVEDVVRQFCDFCDLLPQSDERLLLRYELQRDRAEIGEFNFAYDAGWFGNEVRKSLRFWFGERQPDYVSLDERWKCNFCTFVDQCPGVPKAPR